MRRDEERDHGAVAHHDHVVRGRQRREPAHDRGVEPRERGRAGLASEDELARTGEERRDRPGVFGVAEQLRLTPVVLVEPFDDVDRQVELLTDERRGLHGLRLDARGDRASVEGPQPLGESHAASGAGRRQAPRGRGHGVDDGGQRVFDEDETAHGSRSRNDTTARASTSATQPTT